MTSPHETTPDTTPDVTPDAHYDLIIIGTGSGNSLPSPEFDDWSIAIVEEGRFGGTCLNVGCIPTKMYVYAADQAYHAQHSDRLGIRTTFEGADWPQLVERVFARRIDPIARGGEAYRRGEETPNIDVYDGHARFVAPRTIATAQGDQHRIISGERIVIAAGARPFVPPVILQSGVPYHTNEDIMRLERQPESLIILGGGVIAAEFAHVFDALGTAVTIVNRSPMLRRLDEDVTTRFNELAAQRFDLRLGHTVTAASETEAGVRLTLDDGTTVEAEALLVALGRTPNGDRMGLDRAGIDLREDGRIAVDDVGRTSAEGVWALGDVSSPYQLKHVANAEARAVQHNLRHPEDLRRLPHEHVPSAVFSHPQIAAVGMTEAEARESGRRITVAVQNYGDVAYGWAMEDTEGIVKLIADADTGELLGAHILGEQASTLIQQLITFMAYGIDVRDAARRQYWIHPALPEATENALLALRF